MSEYEQVMFRAVEAPLNDEQLAFARQQSTRADVTRWSLAVNYSYSSFRGDVDVLLCHGYDVFLQYANYGVRRIKLRLPYGLPGKRSVWSKYIDGEQSFWKKDAKGNAGILTLQPFINPGEIEDVWEFEDYMEAAVYLRELLLAGDLRPLYLLWMCQARSDDHIADDAGPPVPHGIDEMEEAAEDFVDFYGLDPLCLTAAGEGVPSAPTEALAAGNLSDWLASLSKKRCKELLHQMLDGDTLGVKAKLLAEIQSLEKSNAWPTTKAGPSFAELQSRIGKLQEKERVEQARKDAARAKREADRAERERKVRLKEMAKAPEKWLKQASKLITVRGTENYESAACILVDLGEAIGGDKGNKMVRLHAARLTKQYPTLNRLKGSLRKRGLLD